MQVSGVQEGEGQHDGVQGGGVHEGGGQYNGVYDGEMDDESNASVVKRG